MGVPTSVAHTWRAAVENTRCGCTISRSMAERMSSSRRAYGAPEAPPTATTSLRGSLTSHLAHHDRRHAEREVLAERAREAGLARHVFDLLARVEALDRAGQVRVGRAVTRERATD